MRRKLNLDFSTTPTQLQRLGFALLALSILVVCALAYAYFDAKSEVELWQSKWNSLNKSQHARLESGSAKSIGRGGLQADLKMANKIIARLNVPWGVLFQEIEGSIDENVTLLSIEPDTETKKIRISAEAKDYVAMLAYAKRLQMNKLFKNAYIQSHQIQIQDPQKPLRFVISSQWDMLASLRRPDSASVKSSKGTSSVKKVSASPVPKTEKGK